MTALPKKAATVILLKDKEPEGFEVFLPHAGKRQTVKPRIIRNQADDAPSSLLHNATFGHTEEAHVKIIQPLALWSWGLFRRAIGFRKIALFLHFGDSGEAVVRRVAKDY